MSRGSSVGIAVAYGLEDLNDRVVGVRFLVE
jgi:hypothetical protein